jgi:hypothetical protein
MTANRNPDQLIRAFLQEGQADLPDQVYDAVRDEIEHIDQQVFIGPWGTLTMNNTIRIALAAAAVVVVAFLGFRLLLSSNVGNTEPTPTPGASQASGVVPRADVGPLAAGTYAAAINPNLTFTVPDGWSVGLSVSRLERHPTAFEKAGTSR